MESLCQAPFQGKLLLTPREAAKALSISERTLYNYTEAGKIEATWLSSQTKRYTPAALQAFIEAAGRGE
jgi:excisionase family DNA binding protein